MLHFDNTKRFYIEYKSNENFRRTYTSEMLVRGFDFGTEESRQNELIILDLIKKYKIFS